MYRRIHWVYITELLWVAQSHSGDYHDNMNIEMFMKWVTEKLVPAFERNYPGKEIVLVADNAPYHHSREIDSLASLTKKKLVEMMQKHEVEYINLTLSSQERRDLMDMEDDEDHPDVQDRGDCVRIGFKADDEQLKRAAASNPRTASLEELKIAFVTYLKEEKHELLDCKVDKYLSARGHRVI